MALTAVQTTSLRVAARSPEVPATWAWPDPLRLLASAWSTCGVPWLATAERDALVQRRCDELVSFARENSPFYRDLYAGVTERDLQSLSKLPIVTKSMVMSSFDDLVTNTTVRRRAVEAFLAQPQLVGRPFASSFAVWTSSGTSGERGIFVHDTNALAVYDALQMFRFRGAFASMDWSSANLALERYALVAVTGGHFAGVASVERLRCIFPWMAQRLQVFSLMQPLGALVAQLNAYQPDIVATYPSAAAVLAHEQQAGRLRISPRQFWTGGECLSEATRRNLQQLFGTEVRDEYGASEFPSIAVGCPAGWMHVNSDWVVLEPVDELYQAVPPGTASHSVLLTNLANRAQPLIRYDLGDSVTMRARPCECGNPLPALRIQGRGDDLLELRAAQGACVRLLPLVLTTILEEGAELYDFQLVQLSHHALSLRLGAREKEKALRAQSVLRTFLDSQGLQAVQIELAPTQPQRDGAGGKLRRILRHRASGQLHPVS